MRWLCLTLAAVVLFGSAVFFAIPVTAAGGPPGLITATPRPTSGPVGAAETCQDAVDGLDALMADLSFPPHLMQEDAVKQGDDFDVNTYFTVLDRLAMQDGYVLDYVYYYDGMGGFPMLYARPEDDAPFQTLDDLYASYGDNSDKRPSYLDSVEVEDTPEGYMQFAILNVRGSLFYLFWHAGYFERQIICSNKALAEFVTWFDEFDQALPEDVQQQALELDATPIVTIGEDTVTVSLLTFTPWGGFDRWTYTFSRDFPHTVELEQETLVEYQIGVVF